MSRRHFKMVRDRDKDPFAYPRDRKIPQYHPINNVIVLFFDIVGFTKNTTNKEMERIIQKIETAINRLLWNDYNWAEKNKHNNLILIPTGDGYGICFHPDIEGTTILYITTELFKSITDEKNINLRMGLAKGPNIRYLDRNGQVNLFGYGINLANRVMSLALDNQILIHEVFAEELHHGEKVTDLIKISEPLKIKHGEEIRVYNYYKKGEFGNPEDPSEKIKKLAYL